MDIIKKNKEDLKECLHEIVQLNKHIFQNMYPWPVYDLFKYQDKLKNLDYIIFEVREGEVLVGDSISFEKEGSWYIWILGVDIQYRKKGIGNTLFDANEKYAKEHGYESVTVKVYNISKDMLSTAIKRGYLIICVEKYEGNDRFNAILLERKLN